MGAGLAVHVHETDEMSYLRISGSFLGGSDILEKTTERLTTDVVVINTAGVVRINSSGVREWVNWMKELDRRGCRSYFVECSPAIVTQCNYFDRFTGSGQIVSFYTPYFCSMCDADKELLIEVSEALRELPFKPPAYRCDRCNQELEFDEFESTYFAFLSSMRSEPLDPALEEMIQQLSAKEKLRNYPTKEAVQPA
jgi:hypothetical protein